MGGGVALFFKASESCCLPKNTEKYASFPDNSMFVICDKSKENKIMDDMTSLNISWWPALYE